MKPYYEHGGVTIHHGDCRKIMLGLDFDSVDAVVTDPPYGLKFMGREWDHGVPGVSFWSIARDALKPGGHLLAFGGTRTHHRLACAIEDAGFEIRDCLMWLYGSGFPKSLDISKAIDREAGYWRGKAGAVLSRNRAMVAANYERTDKGKPVTESAVFWSGYGTALKPAWEPIILARKRLDGTVAANVLEHGTGALNVDGCRIGTDAAGWGGGAAGGNTWNDTNCGLAKHGAARPVIGRFPANLLLDEEAAAMLDEQSGERGGTERVGFPGGKTFGGGDFGGASRFFYTAKAGRSDRGPNNDHPTVKPTDLMRYLVRLVTPPKALVLDPFMGSGSTVYAAREEGCHAIGIEQEERYCEIAVKRLSQEVFAFG